MLSIASNAFGGTTGAEVTGGTGRTDLRFDTGAAITAGKNVAGTINGATAVGIGQSLIGATGDPSEGMNLLVTGGAIGSRGTLNYSLGYASQLNTLVTSLVSNEGPLATRTNGINASIKDIARSKAAINLRLVEKERQYRAQFTALDGVLTKMGTTSTFLTQQLASLNSGL